jgi:cyclopropane-fatty-acyl-phospholipid synthase
MKNPTRNGPVCSAVARAAGAADVRIDGDRPWDPRIHDERFYDRLLADGSLGLGESYGDGWWDCDRLDELFCRLLRAGVDQHFEANGGRWGALRARLFNLQRRGRAFEVGRRHYDLGDDLFRAMLDRRMIYTCGYWKDVATLDGAQEAKLALVAAKLALKPGMRVLDVGCGWGGTAQFLATRHQVEVVGITVSEAQAEHARELCEDLPVEIRLADYRDLDGHFDRVLSLGMFEHVGPKNYATFFRVVRERLADDGLFLLHAIGSLSSNREGDAWLTRHVFPNSVLPSAAQITAAIEGRFVLEDWHNFGADYDTTLMHWHANFERAWPTLAARYGEHFHRLWRYYLLSCAGTFRARRNQLWQIVLSPHGVKGGYRSTR